MNKMTKGAIATGVGVALLLGGGGTLAVWNDSVGTDAGTITAGNLDLEARSGVWTSAHDPSTEIDVKSYKVVPGDVLTYTQTLDVTLAGQRINAVIEVIGDTVTDFEASNISVRNLQLSDSDGNRIAQIKKSGEVTASASFRFSPKTGDELGKGRDDVEAVYDFSKVQYKLRQVAP
ncbi:alternate-type signal peptide domain-containing protein [Crystallibacter degradans]|uniref:alternate-type signal peptide domain-containing protein n=1 Tax=Crystallibacter degradans TaxID=2726743 RepID=UPI001472D776|nr:alternate-type signal peptide domain-containing protein [Arthrobacter sp. SF27]NMR30392.1 alternate-type signal peptide domain-containing protein [Arthrobacter sp. SF27]